MTSLKVLAVGDVDGHLDVFLKRLDSVHKKAGPFELVLCLGSFFSSHMSQENRNLWTDLKSGKKTLPLPVYILGPSRRRDLVFYRDLNGEEMAENLIHLGTQGCLTTREGLKIAYASGADEDTGGGEEGVSFSKEHFHLMETQLQWHESKFNGVDILITSDWPRGVGRGAGVKPHGVPENSGSKLMAKLALYCKPRYHFSALRDCHYERQPYRNHQVLNEPTQHVTRFIGIASVGNKEKKKWMYAFNIIPMVSMEKNERVAQPPDVTDNPFVSQNLNDDYNKDKCSQFFYDMNAPSDGDDQNKKKRCGGRGGAQNQIYANKRPKLERPCWFCLSGEEVEKHLVVSVGNHSYLALPKGGLTMDHVLVLPIAHHANLLELPEEVNEEIEKFKAALRKCFKKQGKVVVFFERNYKSFHLQLQGVPLPKECKDNLKQVYLDVADGQNIELLEIPDHSSLTQISQPGMPYFYVELPDGIGKLYHRVRSGFPIHFGREVLASPSLLNKEKAVNWREINTDKDTEANLAKKFRKLFEPFDFTLEEDE